MKKEEKRIKGLRIAGTVAFLGVLTGISWWMYHRPVEYQVTSLQKGTLERTLSASGDIKTEETKTYYALVQAPIEMLQIKEGDEVMPDEQLVAYDLEALTLEQKEAFLRVQQAESSYRSTVSQNEKNTLLYQGAEITETMFCEMIAEQWELIQNIQKKLGMAEVKANDINWLTSRATLDTDEDDIEDYAAGIDAWRKEYDSMKVPELQAELAKQQAIYSDMQAFRAQFATQKENADARLIDENAQQEILLKKQEAAVQNQDAENVLRDAQAGVWSSFRGIVRERFAESGATVDKGEPLFTIDNLDTLYVAAEISKYDIEDIKLGQKAIIMVGNREYSGEVTKIGRIALEGQSDKAKVPVHIGFLGNTDDVCLGIEADVTIEIEKCMDVMLIDKKGIYEDETGNYVYVISEGIVEKRTVTVGKENGLYCEILEGLSENEQVILEAVTDSAVGMAAVAGVEMQP